MTAGPKGEIRLEFSENDINGDGCSDILTIDLYAMVNRYDLLFFENTSSPPPESCEFDGLNNELIVCIIVTNTDSDNSNISSLTIDQLDVIGLANYTTSQEIDWEWFDVNYRTNARWNNSAKGKSFTRRAYNLSQFYQRCFCQPTYLSVLLGEF